MDMNHDPAMDMHYPDDSFHHDPAMDMYHDPAMDMHYPEDTHYDQGVSQYDPAMWMRTKKHYYDMPADMYYPEDNQFD